MRLPELKTLEAYDASEVVLKYARDYGITETESRLIFKETMKMLWLMTKHQLEREAGVDVPEAFNVHKPMVPLDNMWHEFILFTREYHDFCEKYFGVYLHHIPCSEREFQAFQQRSLEQGEEFIQKERASLGIFVRYVQEHLGAETLQTWFKELPRIALT